MSDIICASCGSETSNGDRPCSSCGHDPLLGGRYQLRAVLGQGAFGTTWRGDRVEDGLPVCLKELIYQRLTSFESERLFRREAAVLRQLQLPGVPRYIDDFEVVTGRAVSLFLVQELVEGETLAAELERHRYREDDVLEILRAVLVILADLHALSPPVIHRDVKPANVMRRRDGSLVLVDLGAVKDVVRETVRGGPSIAGTFGFMAPEQLHGNADPRSDLYGAGALAVALLSRRDPAELVDDHGRLDWAPHVVVGPAVRSLLTSLLDPTAAARPASARVAIERIDAIVAPPVAPPLRSPDLVATPATPATPATSRSRRGWFAIGGLAGLGVLAIVVAGSSSPRAAPVVDVPDRLLGLSLGRSLEELQAAHPDVAVGSNEQPDLVRDRGLGLGDHVRLPGARWRFRTEIAGVPTTCWLDFAVRDGLSRIACELDRLETASIHGAAVDAILSQLRSRYGLRRTCKEVRKGSIDPPMTIRCEWSDQGETLLVVGSFEPDGFPRTTRSKLRIELESAEHASQVAAIRADEVARVERERLAEQSARAAKEAAERDRIERAALTARPL